MSDQGSERISVSRETLRAELTELKIDLIDRINGALATKADEVVVVEHDKRISQLEMSRAAREHIPTEIIDLNKRVSALEKFRYAIPSAAFLSLVISFAVLVYYVTKAH